VEKDVCAIVITYFPHLDRFKKVLTQVCKQCRVLIVDNGSACQSEDLQELSAENGCFLIVNDDNLGIAAAQNKGIEFAYAHGYKYVLLLDQDSILSDGFVQLLMKYAANDRMIVTSGRAINSRNQDVSNSHVVNSSCVEQRDLMSSGTLVHLDTFSNIGLFEESLFIDCVDFEWGWRARSRDVKLILVSDAKFYHTIGDGDRRYKQMPSPIRHYYQSRNIIEMLTRAYVPTRWKLIQLFVFFPKIIKIIIFGSQKRKRLGYLMRGIYDFSRNRFGSFQNKL
tara:strand:- start:10780 stop:11622 length:843 start_codon:yes stop_codon:yes gene_type:complete